MDQIEIEKADSWMSTVPSDQSGSFLDAVLVVRRIVAENHDRPSLVVARRLRGREPRSSRTYAAPART